MSEVNEVLEGTEETVVDENQTELEEAIEAQSETTEGEEGKTDGEPTEYTPNHKYSFMDQEFEFDDKIKSLVKTKEDEDYFRDMVTAQKAQEKYKEFGGLREVESKLGEYDDLTETKTLYNDLNQEVTQLQGMLKAGNIEQFREYLGIPKEQLLNWAVAEAKATQDPNHAAQLQQQYLQQQQTFNLQHQNEVLQNNMEQHQVQQRNVELENELGNSNVAQAYDNLVGTQGSFRQAVIDHGLAELARTGRDISVQEAIQAVEGKFQGLVASETVGTQTNPQAQTQTQVKTPEQTVVINQGGTKTIPNLQAGSQTPAKKQITSLDQIRERARSM